MKCKKNHHKQIGFTRKGQQDSKGRRAKIVVTRNLHPKVLPYPKTGMWHDTGLSWDPSQRVREIPVGLVSILGKIV